MSGNAPPVDAYAAVLAGGVGSRFWPASTPRRPKQLLPLGGDEPMVRKTVERARRLVGRERVRLVAGGHLEEALRDLLPELDPERFLVEPRPRSTGPALAWAAWQLEQADPGSVMVSLHADHVIRPFDRFRDTVRLAVEAAREDRRLYCLGIRPTRPETGYGYLQLAEEIEPRRHAVERFVEKPGPGTAREYLEAGDYVWNTGIFVWRTDALLEAVREKTPEIARALPRLEDGDTEAFFREAAAVSVDRGVMERASRVGCVEADFQWDDVGNWDALGRTLGSDERGNTVVGRARLVEARDNVVWTEEEPVTLFAASGLVVVRVGGETLVTTREAAPRLKELLAELEGDG